MSFQQMTSGIINNKHQAMTFYQNNYSTWWNATFYFEVIIVGLALGVNHLSCNGLS